MRIFRAAALVLAGGTFSGCTAPVPTETTDATPMRTEPVPFDTASATATLFATAAFRGEMPRLRPVRVDEDPKIAEMHREPVPSQRVLVREGKLANVIVWASRGAERWTFATPPEPVSLDFAGALTIPRAVTLQTGQPLHITTHPQHDLHAGHDLHQEAIGVVREGTEGRLVKFERELVGMRITCTVHGFIEAWVGVFSHPFHGATDAEGLAAIRLPPGTYEISVWHEYGKFSRPAPRTVTLADGESTEIEFVFEAK